MALEVFWTQLAEEKLQDIFQNCRPNFNIGAK